MTAASKRVLDVDCACVGCDCRFTSTVSKRERTCPHCGSRTLWIYASRDAVKRDALNERNDVDVQQLRAEIVHAERALARKRQRLQ
jgi:hypothetical protein